MAKYILAIDETGSFDTKPFHIKKWIKSFTCGVCFIDKSEDDVKDEFINLHKKFWNVAPATRNVKDILGDRNSKFHSVGLSDDQLNDCKESFKKIADKAFRSVGTPPSYANNQDWWLTAVVVTIENFLDNYQFHPTDEITIYFDSRKDTTWGVLDENTKPYNPEDETDNDPSDQRYDTFKKYHEFLKDVILNHIRPIIQQRNLNLQIKYANDSNNIFVATADIMCKLIIKKIVKGDFVVGRDCSLISNYRSPEKLYHNKQYVESFTTILHELEKGDAKHISMVPNILSELKGTEDYALIWSIFYDFAKGCIAGRDLNNGIALVNAFIKEMKSILPEWRNTVKDLKELSCCDFVVLMNEFYSHMGALTMPFSYEEFDVSNQEEGRIIRRWENKIRFNLRSPQICYNGYDFLTSRGTLTEICEKQAALMEVLDDKKDNHTSALLGSLAQSYAFTNDIQKAEEMFNKCLIYSGDNSKQTFSYLFTLYHGKGDLEKCREYFKLVTNILPADYIGTLSNSGKYDKFAILSYEKLRALEIKVKGETKLKRFDIENHSEIGDEYPVPLIKKWMAVSLYMEDKTNNSAMIKNLLNSALKECISMSNKFTINTLCLPIIQCLALQENEDIDEVCEIYGQYIDQLRKQSKYFNDYVNEHKDLQQPKNNLDIFERALLLPFIYA